MPSESEILTALFAAAMGDSEGNSSTFWLDFLDLLAQSSHAESAMLQIQWRSGSPVLWQVGANWSAPDLATIVRMRAGRVYSTTDLPAAAISGSDAAGRAVRALKVIIGQEGVALLMLQREGADFRATDASRLSSLVPYIGPALKGWKELEQSRSIAALDRHICRALGAGWIIFSQSGKVQQMAPGMADRLATAAGVYLRADRRLFAPDDNASEALRRGIAAATLHEGDAQFVELSRRPVVQMVIRAESLAGEPVLVGRLRQSLATRDIPEAQLASRFGLSRSEARLAAHLSDGFSLRDAGQALGWTLETTRSCSKQIYAKTGANGQTAVLRRILLDIVWVAQMD
ncbi:helix-turn-helix transcriptional regulator [Sulfitobacter dubius]|uniref:HTH luxR-type domain-containing protein n=1 Tax=Sulfitobacter dubius TaxID=218673 RepID=A0ABY3ZQK1_9RHOB|nr:hypothetical protein [Sulfitobacter dubius]UOA16522.1 hypothetical protein DSM109990_03406 [Sulfitobacter dubius]